MNEKTILEIGLYVQYYKKNITDRYIINNKSLIITNDAIDILDKPQEKLYIEPWTEKIEKDKEIERLNNIIDELGKYLKENYVIDNPIKFKNDLLDKLKELKEGK